MLRERDAEEVRRLRREGLSGRAIARLLGLDRATVARCLARNGAPVYGPRRAATSKLEGFKDYLAQRVAAGVWNGRVLLRELRQRGYGGSYTLLTDWLRPQRQAAKVVAVRRFETPPGQQAQADWQHCGDLEVAPGQWRRLSGFALTLGFSRAMFAEGALDERLGTLLRLHEAAFQQLGGVPAEILYDRMRTVWEGTDERGEIVWNPALLDFARYWGYRPRLCRPYRAQTKGKVESGVKYVRRNFLCGLLGREPGSLAEFNAELRNWIWSVANRRIHGTTHRSIAEQLEAERSALLPLAGRPPYPYLDQDPRRVARDAYVAWEGSRYSVPWSFAGRQVWVRSEGERLEVRHNGETIAEHRRARRRHEIVTEPEHHRGIPLGPRRPHEKLVVHLRQQGPSVEVRPLAAYEVAP